PEFLNRVDELIIFHSLAAEHLVQIVDLMLSNVTKRLADNDIRLEVTDAAKALLIKEGNDPIYGARPLRRAIQKMVEDPISEMILRKEAQPGVRVLVDAKDGQLTFSGKNAVMQE
ncbi:MAG TPA: ATP-dependent Clp protease ATP-binding subunit ClpC, partial [Firmicutes bacterium]|nr:ATP-dependent Clp protease ATP-binding subunit ClpC [Bacillota bacterium]